MTAWTVFLHPTETNERYLRASIECRATGNVGHRVLELLTEAPKIHPSRRMACMLPQKSANSKVPNQGLHVLDGKSAVQGTICHSSSAAECCLAPARIYRSWMADVQCGEQSAIALALLRTTELLSGPAGPRWQICWGGKKLATAPILLSAAEILLGAVGLGWQICGVGKNLSQL